MVRREGDRFLCEIPGCTQSYFVTDRTPVSDAKKRAKNHEGKPHDTIRFNQVVDLSNAPKVTPPPRGKKGKRRI